MVEIKLERRRPRRKEEHEEGRQAAVVLGGCKRDGKLVIYKAVHLHLA